MNLVQAPWIPIRRQNGARECIAPWQLTDSHETNPVVALDAPRPDFNGALTQFLIGLIQVAAPPVRSDDRDWVEQLENPPAPETLRERFARYESAFNMDGEGPRFLQDFDSFDVKEQESVAALLIESPGGNTLKNNADHFIKRGGIAAMCPACIATALFTLQANAPAGGVGHRTSLRGGGPLTTLVVLDPNGEKLQETLWRNVWLNVLNKNQYTRLTGNLDLAKDSDIFPWLAPTRTSDKNGADTFAEQTHPLQMYWAMPRRIRLDREKLAQGECDVCGRHSDRLVQHYSTKNYGVSYKGAWRHPLSPYRADIKTGEIFPIHPQPGGFSYRHWLGWVGGNDVLKPALVVEEMAKCLSARKLPESQLRIHAFGYDMDNMKARCWYETKVPLYTVPAEYRESFIKDVETLVIVAEKFAGFLRSCVKDAWFKRPGDVKGDTTFLADAFYARTEAEFYATVRNIGTLLEGGKESLPGLHAWHVILCKCAFELFDHYVMHESIFDSDPSQVSLAHKKLLDSMYGKEVRKLLKFTVKEKAA